MLFRSVSFYFCQTPFTLEKVLGAHATDRKAIFRKHIPIESSSANPDSFEDLCTALKKQDAPSCIPQVVTVFGHMTDTRYGESCRAHKNCVKIITVDTIETQFTGN